MPPRTISRRTALRVAGGGAAGLLLAACGDSSTSSGSTPVPGTATKTGATAGPGGSTATIAPSSDGRVEPPVISSANGVLDVTLRVAPAMIPFGTGQRWALTVNGTTPGPTLRVKPGDRMRIVLDNQIGHSTNLHTHGLHVAPSGKADNPFIEVKAGEQFTYEIDIPADHPGGLFWYHPHFHHHVAEQLFAGYFGAIIVEDAFDKLPAIKSATDRVLLIHDTKTATTEAGVMSVTGMQQMQGREGNVIFVNGVERPNLNAVAGGLERWRILNASPSRYYRLSLKSHKLQVIGVDGGRMSAAQPVDSLLLVPGERIEVLAQPSAAGTFVLSTVAVDRGSPGMGMGGNQSPTSGAAEILNLVVTGSAAAAPVPALESKIEDLRLAQPATQRELTLSMQGMSLLIDGKAFDSERIDIRGRLGTVEEWTIRNTSTMDHPFHLHVWPFQVLDASQADKPPSWKDVVNVPAGERVRFRVRFSDIPGKTVYHCHILDHEDMGMMGTIEVT